MNLDVLTRPFDASEIRQRDGRGGIGEEPLEITGVKTEMASVKTSISQMKDGRYRIMAELCASDLQPGEITGSVDVYITGRELPVKIPV